MSCVGFLEMLLGKKKKKRLIQQLPGPGKKMAEIVAANLDYELTWRVKATGVEVEQKDGRSMSAEDSVLTTYSRLL